MASSHDAYEANEDCTDLALSDFCYFFLEKYNAALSSLVSHDLMRIVLKAMKLTNYVGVIASNSVEQ